MISDKAPSRYCFKISQVANFQKLNCLPWFLFLQWYHGNWSTPMCLYTIMHGSYGLLWYAKHLCFPDTALDSYLSHACFVFTWVTILIPYCQMGNFLASGQCKVGLPGDSSSRQVKTAQEAMPSWVPHAHIFGTLLMYIMGVTLVMLSDCQKNVLLANV